MEKRRVPLLFSVDLEEMADRALPGQTIPRRADGQTRRLLDWLASEKLKCTFFCVGKTARRYPELIGAIAQAGHEIACHSDAHLAIERLGPEGFARDTEMARKTLEDLTGGPILGYRAPMFSLTAKTPWAHAVLREQGFRYSSSVNPAPSPLYGFPEFGSEPKVQDGVLELPLTILSLGPVRFPFGGIYARLLPGAILRFAAAQTSGPYRALYMHPYDIDRDEPRFRYPEANHWLLSWLMYRGRGGLLDKLRSVSSELGADLPDQTYATFAASWPAEK